jgi:hypothetical protein
LDKFSVFPDVNQLSAVGLGCRKPELIHRAARIAAFYMCATLYFCMYLMTGFLYQLGMSEVQKSKGQFGKQVLLAR